MSDNVKVCVRLRPFNKNEVKRGCARIVDVHTKEHQIALAKRNSDAKKHFTFDYVYDVDTAQKTVYESTAFSLVESVMEGYNGTIFAYGQTGCGKTHSMEGVRGDPELRGITPNAFTQIFDTIATSPPNVRHLVGASYIEIYNEEVRDLLGDDPKKPLKLREDPEKGVYIAGLKQVIVKDPKSLNALMDKGSQNRSVAATAMNAGSSRSHSIFSVYVESSTPDEDGGEAHIVAAKLNLVDLAGSERQSKTMAEGKRLKEATKINLSLSALGNVISALVDGHGSHIPYRDSKLTRLLQDSLGGNTKTVMIACVGPADYNYDETLSTLRYANRAKNIKNRPKINEDPKDALLREYESEIIRLRRLLKDAGLDYTSDIQIRDNATSRSTTPRSKKKEAKKKAKPRAEVDKMLIPPDIGGVSGEMHVNSAGKVVPGGSTPNAGTPTEETPRDDDEPQAGAVRPKSKSSASTSGGSKKSKRSERTKQAESTLGSRHSMTAKERRIRAAQENAAQRKKRRDNAKARAKDNSTDLEVESIENEDLVSAVLNGEFDHEPSPAVPSPHAVELSCGDDDMVEHAPEPAAEFRQDVVLPVRERASTQDFSHEIPQAGPALRSAQSPELESTSRTSNGMEPEQAPTAARSTESPSETSSQPSKQPHLCHELQISKSGDVELINVTEMESKRDAEKRHEMGDSQNSLHINLNAHDREASGETGEVKRLREERETTMVRQQLEKTQEKFDEIEKQKVAAELAKIQAQEENLNLADKLAMLEARVVEGTKSAQSLKERHAAEMRLAAQRQKKLKRQREKLREQQHDQDTGQTQMAESFSSVQQKMAAKQRKIAKLENKVQCAKEEIQDLQEEFQQERVSMLSNIRDLQREVKFFQQLSEKFVNDDQMQLMQRTARWDEELEGWDLPKSEIVRLPSVASARSQEDAYSEFPQRSASHNARASRQRTSSRHHRRHQTPPREHEQLYSMTTRRRDVVDRHGIGVNGNGTERTRQPRSARQMKSNTPTFDPTANRLAYKSGGSSAGKVLAAAHQQKSFFEIEDNEFNPAKRKINALTAASVRQAARLNLTLPGAQSQAPEDTRGRDINAEKNQMTSSQPPRKLSHLEPRTPSPRRLSPRQDPMDLIDISQRGVFRVDPATKLPDPIVSLGSSAALAAMDKQPIERARFNPDNALISEIFEGSPSASPLPLHDLPRRENFEPARKFGATTTPREWSRQC